MVDKEKLTLMYRDLEVLSFEIDYVKEAITFLEKLKHFDKAPYGINDKDEKKIQQRLFRFFYARKIAPTRNDCEKIIQATNCRNTFELSFKGHGLSLSNHYWVRRDNEKLKYSDINFFANKWDDSFGRAVLSKDYEALKTCDLNVPDVVTNGWGVKGWIYDNGPKLYKLGIDKDQSEEAICEVLASRLANRLFDEGEALLYELKTINGHYASVSPSILNADEELFPIINILPFDLYNIYREKSINKESGKIFFQKLREYNLPEIYKFFIKVSCFRCLGFVSDFHFDNISIIRNMKTNEIRPAPLFDFGGAFGSSKFGKSLISNPNKGVLLLVYFLFNDLDPDWDYSWYNPRKLEGFEEEIREYLSKSDFYTPDLIERVIEVYKQQKRSLDEMASAKE